MRARSFADWFSSFSRRSDEGTRFNRNVITQRKKWRFYGDLEIFVFLILEMFSFCLRDEKKLGKLRIDRQTFNRNIGTNSTTNCTRFS